LSAHKHGPISQAKFLDRMGLEVRIEMLKAHAKTEERKNEIEKAGKRLVDTAGMGSQYQVLGLTCGGGYNAKGVWPFMEPGIEGNG
jgi:NADH dehydrogenase [ubiquinone] 1 alpha subcomplex assembly factor 7